MNFIEAIEEEVGRPAIRNFIDMRPEPTQRCYTH